MADVIMTVVSGDPNEWPFIEVLIDVIVISLCRIIWDIHFILVHRRVFRETIRLHHSHELDASAE